MTDQPATPAAPEQGTLQAKAAELEATRAKAPTLRGELERYRGDLAVALPRAFPGGVARFERIVLTAVSKQPELAACTPRSIIGAAIQAAQLGLTPNLLGQCWILPYRDNKKGVVEAQFQIGWKGLVELAGRAGIRIDAETVYERDEFHYEYGLDPILRHRPADGDRGPAVRWYAVAHFRDGGKKFAVIDRQHVEKRRAASKSPDSPAWKTWYDEMAKGKAVRELCRTLVLSVEIAEALAVDEQVSDWRGRDDVIDVDPDTGEVIPPGGD